MQEIISDAHVGLKDAIASVFTDGDVQKAFKATGNFHCP
jgi:hypothetical protein